MATTTAAVEQESEEFRFTLNRNSQPKSGRPKREMATAVEQESGEYCATVAQYSKPRRGQPRKPGSL